MDKKRPPPAFVENLKTALFSKPDLIHGYVMMSMLSANPPVDIIKQVKELMKPREMSDERLQIIYSDVHRCGMGLTCQTKELNWRESRMAVATFNYSQYQLNNSVLDRIVCIDETSILAGRLVLVAAVIKFRFLVFDFVVNGKATNKIMEDFLIRVARALSVAKISDPILIWDNINVHRGAAVTDFIVNNGWTVWPQPVNSSDMQPLDYSDFKALNRATRKDIKTEDLSVDEAKGIVVRAIHSISSEGSLQGIVQLPGVWESLMASDGLATKTLTEHAQQ